jgi:excinuclease ABC subunit A
VLALSIEQALEHFGALPTIARHFQTLTDVGLGYMRVGQPATTLSGGEAQRIRLAAQIGSALEGVIYVLDEPSIGLHERDNQLLICILKKLRDLATRWW